MAARIHALASAVVAAVVLALAAASPAAGEDPPKGPPPGGPALVPVERFFHGKILKLEGHEIEIRYDFEDPAQLRDFAPSIPFRAIRTIETELKNGRLSLKGTGSFRHVAVFDDHAGASVVFTPRKPKDFGLAVTEERESEVFTLYCCYDRYFGAGDGVHVPQNMVIKFIPRDPKANKDGLQDWRYCGSRGQTPEILPGRAHKVSIVRKGLESGMTIDDWESKPTKEAGRDLTAMMVALYGYDAFVEADDLVLRGKLSAPWVAKNRIDLTTWTPPAKPEPGKGEAPAAVEGAVAERIRAQIGGYPLETKPQALAALLRDTSVPAALRAEAAEKAKQAGTKRIVPFLVDGLYASDLDVRRHSFDVLRTLTGKTFNYRPDGPEEGRKKAIQELNDYLRRHPDEFARSPARSPHPRSA